MVVIELLNIAIIWYFIILSLCYSILLFSSIWAVNFEYKSTGTYAAIQLFPQYYQPPVTVFITVYNNADTALEATLNLIHENTYKKTKIVIINDGSTDNSLQLFIEYFNLIETNVIALEDVKVNGKIKKYYIPKINLDLILIDKENGGKSDALNAGLLVCNTSLILTLDSDTILENDAIQNLIYNNLIDVNTAAVGGAVYILNGCKHKDGVIINRELPKSIIVGIQAAEYMRSFVFSREGLDRFGGALCHSGTITMLSYKKVKEVGGFAYKNPAQDFEIILALQAYKYEKDPAISTCYSSAAVAWTQVPTTLKSYLRQRYTWQYGSLISLMRYKRMLFNYRYKVAGMFSYPFYLFGEILSAVVEFTAYLLVIVCFFLGIQAFYWLALIFVLCWGFMLLLTLASALLNSLTYKRYDSFSDVPILFLMATIDIFGFRQFQVVARTLATFAFCWNSIKQRIQRNKQSVE